MYGVTDLSTYFQAVARHFARLERMAWAAGRRPASVSQPRKTHSSSITPYIALVAVS